jgi:hypothetical protein
MTHEAGKPVEDWHSAQCLTAYGRLFPDIRSPLSLTFLKRAQQPNPLVHHGVLVLPR